MESRTAPGPLEFRGDNNGYRTLLGTVVPDVVTYVGRYHDSFRRGGFANTPPEDVPLIATHAHDELHISRAVEFADTETGLEAAPLVSETRTGDDVLALVRNRAATGKSVGFVPMDDIWDTRRIKVERARARLVGVSVVAFPAYDG